jgi:hypothetical protein
MLTNELEAMEAEAFEIEEIDEAPQVIASCTASGPLCHD